MPDFGAILVLSTIMSFGHGCPVSATVALTARHVVDPRPLDGDSPMLSVQWSAGELTGNATPRVLWLNRDLALLDGTFANSYAIAATAPAIGSNVYLVGFNWDSFKDAMAEKPIKAKVVRLFGGQILYDKSGLAGSSGSCVLNAEGQVVAINTATLIVGSRDQSVGLGVAVWGLDVKTLEKPEVVVVLQ